MHSLKRPGPLSLGSASSAAGQFIGSYRRSQLLIVSSSVLSEPAFPLTDEEATNEARSEIQDASGDEDSNDVSDREATPTGREHVAEDDFHLNGMIADLGTVEDDPATVASQASSDCPQHQPLQNLHFHRRAKVYMKSSTRNANEVDERTRLLRGSARASFSAPQSLRDLPEEVKNFGAIPEAQNNSRAESDATLIDRSRCTRRPSSSSAKNLDEVGGESTNMQTLVNAIAILVGIGMLSEPIAFAYAGWIGGTFLIVTFGFITCYTAKLLAGIILADPSLQSYADIGRKAFGPRSNALVSTLFCTEIFAVSVVLVTLYGDSLHTILPQYSSNTYKLCGVLVIIPTLFMPLSLLSYASIIGFSSTIMIIAVIFIDGFTKEQSPGSLWHPAETNFGIQNTSKLGVALGLFMAGLSGHAVIPSLARDMIDPTQFDFVINWAFTVATVIYGFIGVAGYLMFGNAVSDEVSVDLLNTPGFNVALNKVALWMLVISPLTKFALATRPVNIVLESMFGINTTSYSQTDRETNLSDESPNARRNLWLKRFFIVLERISFLSLAVGVSIVVPEFSKVMAFLGSFSAFVICVIGPVSVKIAFAGKCGLWDGLLLGFGIVCAVWGTISAFAST